METNISILDELMTLERLEKVTKILLSFIGVCYAVGILVINIYYGEYGFYTLSLFRLSYAIAGFWAIIILVFGYLLVFIIINSFLLILKPDQTKTRLGAAIVFFTMVIGSIEYIIIIFHSLEVYLNWDWIWIVGVGCIALYGITQHIKLIIILKNKILNDLTPIINVLVGIAFLIGYLIGFSQKLYDKIPAKLGGGRPQLVQFVVHKSFVNQLREEGINIAAKNDSLKLDSLNICVTDTLHLLLYTESDLIFTTQRDVNKSYSIARESIIALKCLKE